MIEYNKNNLLVILGNQLFPLEYISQLNINKVYMKEDIELCTYFKHHKMKLTLFLTAMRDYRDLLKKNDFEVHYKPLKIDQKTNNNYIDDLRIFLKENKINRLYVFDIVDKFFKKKFLTLSNEVDLTFIPSPMFFLSQEDLKEYGDNNKNLRMVSFYQMMRKKLNLLIDENEKPTGGKWSFDELNRKRLPKEIKIPATTFFNKSKNIDDVKLIVDEYFSGHPGDNKNFWAPTNRKQALNLLKEFIELKFKNFGDFEDAVDIDENFLFHSCLSSSLNLGLITPKDVIEEVNKSKDIPLNSLEGFIRQIIGWREFIRLIYFLKGDFQENSNYWKHDRKLKDCWYDGTTNIKPLDDTIKKCLKYGYVHHIPRLMILSNIMNLCKISPKEIYRWFMEMFVDSSDWVMVPNVYGMGTYADGGIFSTKPYICGSNYILKMSNYKKDKWCDVMDGLYWSFIDNNKSFFSKNPRLNMMVRTLERMNVERKKIIFEKADEFIENVTYI